ncbi:hypothetical protein HBB16_12355 [Pseudonocardia sp. MCCB 268]|nr:hypothetical protein [Pseudonocardia cytotoxica]
MHAPPPPRATPECCEAISIFDVRDRLGSCVGAAIASAEDPATAGDGQVIADGAPASRFEAVADCAHLLNARGGRWITPTLATHLASVGADRN